MTLGTLGRTAHLVGCAASLGVSGLACGEGGDAPTKPTPVPQVRSLSLTPASVTLTAGEGSLQLVAVVSADPGADVAVRYVSSAPGTVSVTSDGVVTGLVPGSAVITATAIASPTVQATSTIVVRAASPQIRQITLSSTATEVFAGAETTVRATTTGDVNASPALTWTTSNPAVATILASVAGTFVTVTGVAPGIAMITATSVATPSVSASFTVTVRTPRVVDIRLSSTSVSTIVGTTTELTVQALGETGDDGRFGLGTPTSSDTTVATVTRDGIRVTIRGVRAGTARLTFPTINPNVAATATVTVLPVPQVRGVAIRDSVVTLFIGGVHTVYPSIYGDPGADTRVKGLQSSDSTIVMVGRGGTVDNAVGLRGASAGTATIFVLTSNPAVVGTIRVIVLPPRVYAITVDSTSVTATLPATGGQAVVTVGYRVTSESGASKAIIVTSSNPDVAVAVVGNGVVTITAKSPGSATIALTSEFDPSVTARIQVTVRRAGA